MSEPDNPEREKQPLRLTFRIVGPIRSSTLERDHPDPEWQALSDLLYWSWCCRLQASRLRHSFLAQFPLGKRPYVRQRYLFATTSFDEHAFTVAAGNLVKALRRAPKSLRDQHLSEDTTRALRLLRDIYEHWENMRAAFRKGGPEKTAAAQKLAKDFPEAEPWTIAFHEDGDIVLAEVVSLSKLVTDLRILEAAAHWRQRKLQREGRHKAVEPDQAQIVRRQRRTAKAGGGSVASAAPNTGPQADG